MPKNARFLAKHAEKARPPWAILKHEDDHRGRRTTDNPKAVSQTGCEAAQSRASATDQDDSRAARFFAPIPIQALKYTIPLATEFGATIHLVHVQLADELTAIENAGGLMLSCVDAIALMQDRLSEAPRNQGRFRPHNCHVVSGRPFEEICKLARRIEVDLIASKKNMLQLAEAARRKIVEEGRPEQMRESKHPILVQFLNGSTEGPMLAPSKYHMLSPAD